MGRGWRRVRVRSWARVSAQNCFAWLRRWWRVVMGRDWRQKSSPLLMAHSISCGEPHTVGFGAGGRVARGGGRARPLRQGLFCGGRRRRVARRAVAGGEVDFACRRWWRKGRGHRCAWSRQEDIRLDAARDDGFSEAPAGFDEHFARLGALRAGGEEDAGDIGGDEALDDDGHGDLGGVDVVFFEIGADARGIEAGPC